jgi:hypothetical protein
LNNITRKGSTKLGLIVSLVAVTALSAMAQSTTGGGTGPDYTGALDGYTTSMQSFLTLHGPKILIALAGVLMFGIIWKLSKRVAKSI